MPAEQVHLHGTEKVVLPRPCSDLAPELHRIEIHQARVQPRHVLSLCPRLQELRFIPASEQLKFPILNLVEKHHVSVAYPERSAFALNQFLDPFAFGQEIDVPKLNPLAVYCFEKVRKNPGV